ncbi:fimbrial protein [Burkholderia sp. Bp9002]|nr:fimbrial protein [Burkholderia sp. Bp9002]
MKRIFAQLLLFSLFALFAQKSYALACLKDNSQVTDTVTIDTSIAISNTLPKDTVLWRSPVFNISVTCWPDRFTPVGEYVYFYLSPTDRSLTQLGPDLELGIGLGGRDVRCSQEADCRVKLPIYFDKCGSVIGCKYNAQTFTISFTLFASKKSLPSAGKEGSLTGAQNYGAFQLDGVDGLNPAVNSNFRMYVNGLNKLRYIGCASTLAINPNTIDFGQIQSSSGVRTGTRIMDKTFDIVVTKSCSSFYGLNAYVKPINASVANDNLLVPNDNPSVAISLFKQQNMSTVPLQKEFVLVPPSSDQVVVNPFVARLQWNTDRPVVGKFNAAAAIDIYYK